MTEPEYKARIKWLEAELQTAREQIDVLVKNLLARAEKKVAR